MVGWGGVGSELAVIICRFSDIYLCRFFRRMLLG